jgi:hypothetical protein
MNLARFERIGVSADVQFKRWNFFWGTVLLAGLASQAYAGPVTFGICSSGSGSSQTNGASTIANYQSASDPALLGCSSTALGLTSTIGAGGSINPTSLPLGLTTTSLSATQLMSISGTNLGNAVGSGAVSLDTGIMRALADTEGTAVGCGGTCMSTGGGALAEEEMNDLVHFIITNGAGSAIVTVSAHLDGFVGSSPLANNTSFQVNSGFLMGGGSACWASQGGNPGVVTTAFGPCASQNFGFLTSSFSNQSSTGYDFTGTFSVTNGEASTFLAYLQVAANGGEVADFSHTSSMSLILPSNVTFSSDSGVLFSQTASAPEPATLGGVAAVLLGIGLLRRKR